MLFTGAIEDRLAIRDLYGSFSYSSSLENMEEWLDCWTEDCQWTTHYFAVSGKEELRQQWHKLWANFDKLAFLCEIGSMAVDGDRATVGCIAREIIRLSTGGVYKLAGCYSDELVRLDGRWLFARREYQVLVEELPEATQPSGP